MAQTAEETGLPGRPRTGTGAQAAEQERLAGPHRDLPEGELEATHAQRVLDQVVVADGGAAGGDEGIQTLDGLDPGSQRRRLVGGDAEVDRLAAPEPDHGGEGGGVRADDLARPRRLARPAQLVARRQDAHARSAPHGQPRLGHDGGEAQLARAHDGARGKADPARPEVEPGRANELALSDGAGEAHAAAVGLGILLDGDGVGAGRDHPAREDAHGFAWGHLAREGMAGRCRAHHLQPPARWIEVGGADGVAVHGGDGGRAAGRGAPGPRQRARGPGPGRGSPTRAA